MPTSPPSAPLAPYRVLDLTDERGLLAGHLLAQLGADVIQVEPPEGSGARRVGPFADGESASFFWSSYAAGKRSIRLDLATPEGRGRLLELARQADVLIESAGPGVMAALMLGHEDLKAVNPRLVYVSITAFGAEGPKAGYADSDLVVWAAAGPLWPHRTPDGLPLRISTPQAFHQAATDAASGAILALLARGADGRGQHVEVSARQSSMLCTLSSHLAAAVRHPDFNLRGGVQSQKLLDLSGSGARTRKTLWDVRDGMVALHIGMGPAAGRYANNLFAWLRDLGELPDAFADWDWVAIPGRIESGEITLVELEQTRAVVGEVLARHTKDELLQVALDRDLMLAPVMDAGDLRRSRQLAARDFYVTVQEGDARRTLPSPFNSAGGQAAALRPAPRLGQHDGEGFWEPKGDQALAAPEVPMAQPLAGLKVLDLAWVVAGPLIGRALADFGATVVRVESTRRVDTARLMGPFPDAKFDTQQSLLFENCNAGKLGVTLDLASPEGQRVARDLVAWADVVIESFGPGQMARFGLDYPQLKEINPGLIMLSTSLMGQTGPLAAFAGFGNIGAALSGFQKLVGLADAPPIGPFGPYTDYIGPRFSLIALLAAVDRRRRTGEGARLDISQVEAAITLLAPEIADYDATGRIATAQGNRDARFAPSGVFQAAGEDRWVALTARDDGEWRRLAALIGGAELAEDPRFAAFAERKQNEDALEALIAAWTAARDAVEIEQALQAIGVPAHVAAASEDIIVDPQVAARGELVRMAHARMGETIFDAARCRLSETPADYVRTAPTFGRDNRQVLAEFLGYSEAEIEALQTAGVLS